MDIRHGGVGVSADDRNMKWLIALGAVVAGWLWIANRLRRDRPDVSQDWLIDNDRRVCGSGIDAPSISWPIDKARNEQAWRNRQQLRRRA